MDLTFLHDWPLDIQLSIRLLLAFLLSTLIGREREDARRPAGLRTHILVGVGAAAFMLVSTYGFEGLTTLHAPNTSVDLSRIAAQIVSGIGFIGAGAIWRSNNSVGGLTTAASIWVTASIGMLAAAGLVVLAMVVTAMSWFTLRWLKPQNHPKTTRRVRQLALTVSEAEQVDTEEASEL